MITKSKIKNVESCKKVLSIEVPAGEVRDKFDEVYNAIATDAKIDGFRQGKAPMDIIKKQFASAAKEEVVKRLIGQAYTEVLDKEGIRPVGYPQIERLNFEEGKPMTFDATVEVHPDINIKSYKAIKIKKKKAAISESEKEVALKSLQESLAHYEVLKDRTTVNDKDYIIADVECLINGKAIEKKDNSWLYIEKDAKDPNLTRDLAGKNVGDTVDIDMKLPGNYHMAQYRNSDAKFIVKIKEIRQKNLPPLNDDFAKDVGKFQNMQELTDAITKEILAKKEYNIRIDMENQMIDQLVKKADFDLPQSLVKKQADHALEQALNNLKNENIKPDELEAKKKDLTKESLSEAQNQLKVYYILSEIARAEGKTVSDEEADAHLKSLIERYHPGRDINAIKQSLSPEDYEDIRVRLRNKKVMDFLIDNAVIEEE